MKPTFTHNLPCDPRIAAAVSIIAEHVNKSKTATVAKIITDWSWERPAYQALIDTHLQVLQPAPPQRIAWPTRGVHGLATPETLEELAELARRGGAE